MPEHPLTVAVHQGDTSVDLTADTLEAARELLSSMLDLIRRDDCESFGTIRHRSGVLLGVMPMD